MMTDEQYRLLDYISMRIRHADVAERAAFERHIANPLDRELEAAYREAKRERWAHEDTYATTRRRFEIANRPAAQRPPLDLPAPRTCVQGHA